MCQKELVGKPSSLADLQHLNPQLFKPRREPTVNIAQAILCTFFPPPPAPALPVPLPSSSPVSVQPSHAVEVGRSSPPSSHSVFSLTGVKASLGFTASNSAPLPLSPLVPTAVAIPPPLPLPPSSQLCFNSSGESFILAQQPCARPPFLPSWVEAMLEGGGGALGGACKTVKVSYTLVFTSDGSKDAVAAAAAAAAAAIAVVGEGADMASQMSV